MSDATAWLVMGLGNPGASYAANRHNVGAMVLDVLASRASAAFSGHRRTRSDVVETRLGTPGSPSLSPSPPARVVLAKPRSFMNESGGPAAALLGYYRIPAGQLVVVHDELDLPYQALRLKRGGGDNGHNGLRSIRAAIGSGDFCRVRVGIGRPPGRQDPAAYVLRDFSPTERTELPLLCELAADAVECLVTMGLERAQNQYNS